MKDTLNNESNGKTLFIETNENNLNFASTIYKLKQKQQQQYQHQHQQSTKVCVYNLKIIILY